MNKHVFITTFLISLIFSFKLHSQTGKFYSSDKELSNSLINHVYQDKRGFIWISTEDGLNKFDGNKFTIYKHNPKDSTSLFSNYVKSVFEDGKNRFWILGVNNVQLYDRSTDTFQTIPFRLEEGKVGPHTANIMERKNKEIWMATYGQGVVTFKDGMMMPNDELNSMTGSYFLHAIYEDKSGNIWIATQDRGLFQYSPSNNVIKRYNAPKELTSEDFSSICEDKTGNLFVSTLDGGLMKFNKETDKFESILYEGKRNLSIKTLMTDSENNLYIGTEGYGLKQYDRDNNCIIDCDINIGIFDLTSSKVHSLLEDKAGNLWLGIFQKGLAFVPSMQNKFNYYGYKSYKKSCIGSSCVMSIHRDVQGVIWVATDNDGLYAINDEGKQLAHFKDHGTNQYAPPNIMCILEDSEGHLWAGSYLSGLAKIDKKTGISTYIDEFSGKGGKAKKEKIFFLLEDQDKNIWVSTYGSGIYKISLKGDILSQYQSDKTKDDDWGVDKLCHDWVNCMMQDDQGLLWIGTNKGLSCFDPIKETFLNYFSKNNLLPDMFIHALVQDSDGLIWIGTSEGLFCFDKMKGEFKKYTMRDGLPSDVICGIVEDIRGDLWISTHQGISKLVVKTNSFINYYSSDGIQGNEFTRGAFSQDQRGVIYFGGTSGVTSFHPNDITEQKRSLKVEIIDFIIANHSVRKGDKSGNTVITDKAVIDTDHFTLAHNHNSFTLDFSTLEFINPEKIVYQYKISGLHSDWMSTNAGVNRVTFTGLTPGEYTFMVRAKDNEVFSNIRKATILITPPWHQTWWAICIWILLGMALLYAFSMYLLSVIRHKREMMERRHAEQINEAKLQFFINISHEIRTPMTLIINPLEKLIRENEDGERQKSYLMIYRNAQRILRLINQLMDIRKLDKGQMHLKCRETDMVGFIQDVVQTFEYQAQKKNIKFDFIHPDEQLKVWIDLNNYDKILMNILSNAFKYTPDNGEITIELRTGKDETVKTALKRYFEIIITDSGIGIDRSKIEQIFERFYQINNDVTNSNFGTGIGLHLSRSLVELHHGVIYAENRTDSSGSRFIIRTPLGCDHLKAEELENPEDSNMLSISRKEKEIIPELQKVENTQAEKSKSRTKYRVLIVEDEDEIRQYLSQELSSEYRVSECNNGKEAWKFILTEKPDLIITDVMMLEMDGITLCKKIKQNINVSHIPVVLLTAKSKIEDKVEGLDIGADAYIVKPFNTTILISTISNLIDNRERLKTKFSGNEQQEDKVEKIKLRSSDEILMGKVMKTINENLSNPELNVEMLAYNVGLSRVHMHRKLKELTNQSARDFIRGIRLKQASELMVDSKLTISEIAYATGFSSLPHFSHTFKEFYGMSPKEYMAKHSDVSEK